MSVLRLFLPPLAGWTPSVPVPFALLGANRRVLREGTAPLAGLPKADRCELVLAAQDVLLTTVKLPRLTGNRLRAALPHLLEENLLTDVEDVFVALGPAEAGHARAVAAVQREPLLRVLAACRKAELNVVSAYPVSLTNPVAPRQWSCVADSHAAWVRGDAHSAMSLSPVQTPQDVPVELALAVGRVEERPERLVVCGNVDLEAWSAALGLPVVAGRYERHGFEAPAFNLLQFELAPDVLDWKAWRWPAGLAAAALLVAIAGLNLQWMRLDSEKQALRSRMETTYRAVFPEAQVVVDPLLQMQRQVADMRVAGGSANPDDFLPIANAVGLALQPHSNPVRGLEYRDGQLRLRLAPDLANTPAKREAVSAQLKSAGFTAQFNNDETVTIRRAGT